MRFRAVILFVKKRELSGDRGFNAVTHGTEVNPLIGLTLYLIDEFVCHSVKNIF